MSDSVRRQKEALRAVMRERRAAVPPETQDEAGRRIIETVFSGRLPIPVPGRDSILALYVSDSGEPNFMPCLSRILRQGVICCFPAFRKGEMGFYAPTDESDFIVGTFGIREPGLRSRPFSCAQIDMMLVPGLAFDRTGSRLGRGKGFYDRYLGAVDPEDRPVTIGTGYEFQRVGRVPTQPGDIRMDLLVTPETYFVTYPNP
jgi:5-formyltetrahydrofolate cyclo-ligase